MKPTFVVHTLSGGFLPINCDIGYLTDNFLLTTHLLQQLPGHWTVPFQDRSLSLFLAEAAGFLQFFSHLLWGKTVTVFPSHPHVQGFPISVYSYKKPEIRKARAHLLSTSQRKSQLESIKSDLRCWSGRPIGAGRVAGEAKHDWPGSNRSN